MEDEKREQLNQIRQYEIEISTLKVEIENQAIQSGSKVELLQSQLDTESKAREDWMQRYLEEQQLQMKTAADLLESKTKHKDLMVGHADLKVKFGAL